MAFTQNPVDKTQSTKRFSFVGPMEQRSSSSSKDQRFVNWLPELTEGPAKENKQWWLRTRPGLTSVYTTTNSTPRGCYYWNSHVMSVAGSSIYYDGTFLSTITTSTGNVGWAEFLDSTGVRKLVMLDGTKGYVFTAHNVAPTEITSGDFPTPHVPTPIFLDGYLFVAKADTQDVYNSNLNDPLLWTAGDYISAEMYPDTIQGLSRNNNYIFAVGKSSIEFLYDAANASGSPLSRHDSAVQQFGTPAVGTIVAMDKEVVMVGQINEGGRSVWALEGFKENEIATLPVRLALNAEGTNITSARAYAVKVGGQKQYVLCLTSRIFVYTFETKLWTEWGFTNTPYYACDSEIGYPYLQVNTGSNTIIAKMDDAAVTDLGNTITCTIVTSRLDFETTDRKRMDQLVLMGDAPNGANDVPISVQWSNDDYQTWSTARTLNINPVDSDIRRLGMFRRRALKFTYTQPYALRLEGMEITINKGQT